MFRFVTDTPSGLSPEQAKAIGVDEMAPSYVRFGDEQYRETYDMTLDEFHAKFKSNPNFPTTSAPSVGDFQDIFEKYKGDTVLSINLSRDLSGTVTAAENAANIAGGDITVIGGRSRRRHAQCGCWPNLAHSRSDSNGKRWQERG